MGGLSGMGGLSSMMVVAPIRPKRRILPGTGEQVRQARLFVRHALGDCPVVDDAVLLVSELATNAIAHTASGHGGKYLVTVYRDQGRARVEVLDGGSDKVPEVRSREDGRESGNGLALIDRIATRWGHRGGPRQRVVWFELEWC
jgi:anti-sigma regulatory factor (Ser/Thr protein kinase)